MAEPWVYKPNTRKGPVLLAPTDLSSPPTITLPNGQVITARRGDQAGGVYKGHEGYQWVFPQDVLNQQGAVLNAGGQTQTLGSTNMSYRGSSLGSLSESNKGALGSGSSTGSGIYAPNQVGNYGYAPADLTGQFPSASMVNYTPIQAADFNFTDPASYANQYAEVNRAQDQINLAYSKYNALNLLDTELEGLTRYAPAASALKRRETSADNIFNQQERTAQIDTALPGVRQNLQGQASRANAFAQGQIPDDFGGDSAYELNSRSRAAENNLAGGFGANSSVARKASDLMSVERRLQLSQYGDTLLSNNANQQANLFLAPTSYSNAGQQISVIPSISGSQLQQNQQQQLNANTTISPTNALSSTIQQEQFFTNLNQQTNQFNASNQLTADTANAAALNNFALDKFGYQVGLAGANAGAAQTNRNTEIALQQQERYERIFSDMLNRTQTNNTIGSVFSGLGTFLQTMFGNGSSNGEGSLWDQIIGYFGDGESSDPYTLDTSDIPSDSGYTLDGSGSSDVGFTIDGSRTGDIGGGYDLGVDEGILGEELPTSGFSSDELLRSSNAVLRSAGVYSQPQPGTTQTGFNDKGQPVFMNAELNSSNDTNSGFQRVSTLKNIVQPFNVLTTEDSEKLDNIGATSSSPEFITQLDYIASNQDTKSFKDTINKAFNISGKDVVKTGVASTRLLKDWGNMSGAQKSLALTSIGLQGYKTVTGTDLSKQPIVKNEDGSTAMTLGEGLNLMSQGYNTYSLAKNWNQLDTIQKIIGGVSNANNIARMADSFGLLGSGVNGAEVPGVTLESLTQQGWTPATNLGVGAVVGDGNSQVPNGYRIFNRLPDGRVLAAPEGSAASITGSVQTGVGIGSAAYRVYKGWGSGGSAGLNNGIQGGSALASGLMRAGETNPYVLGAVITSSILGNVSKNKTVQNAAAVTGVGAVGYSAATDAGTDAVAGNLAPYASIARGAYGGYRALTSDGQGAEKSKALRRTMEDTAASYYTAGLSDLAQVADQKFLGGTGNKIRNQADALNPVNKLTDKIIGSALDSVGSGKGKAQQARDVYRKAFNDNGDWSITLADGAKADIGQERTKGKQNFDIDVDNDLNFTAAMGGMALTRLIGGGVSTAGDQIGSQIGNAVISNISGKEYTQGNFNKLMGNLRAVYSQKGITSKDEAYQLANQAFSEGRIDESTLVQMQQTFNLMYNSDGYNTGVALMSGRGRGKEVSEKSDKNNPNVPNNNTVPNVSTVTKDQKIEQNKKQFSGFFGKRFQQQVAA